MSDYDPEDQSCNPELRLSECIEDLTKEILEGHGVGTCFVPTAPANRAAQFKRLIDSASSRLERIVTGEISLIVPWKPNSANHEIIEHCDKLQIPEFKGHPCILLHELGDCSNTSFDGSKDRAKRISDIFSSEYEANHILFLNTAGSGKTRLMLEGLCQHWGFYFTCKTGNKEIGSSDISLVNDRAGCLAVNGLKKKLTLTPKGTTIGDQSEAAQIAYEEIHHNEEIASRCYHAVLAARLVIFARFLLISKAALVHGTYLSTLNPRKAWLFVQIDTRLLGDGSDIFRDLTALLSTISATEKLTTIVLRLTILCQSMLQQLGEVDILHCVVDEAQTAAETFPRAFSNRSGHEVRPALRAMLSFWVGHGLHLIITGTSINLQHIKEALSSTIGKYDSVDKTITDTGSVADSNLKIKNYLKKYLPQQYLTEPSGKELLFRATYWLYGRPRFVAAFVQFVMDHGFQSYHRLLTAYVLSLTRFKPTDAEYWEASENPVKTTKNPLCPFDFSRAQHMQYVLLELVQKLTYERLMSGTIQFPVYNDPESIKLVECGFARYPSSRKSKDLDPNIVMDEPLAYLAADLWINQQGEKKWKQRHKVFADEIGVHSTHSNGLERYAALCLADAFKVYTPLSQVFNFANNEDPQGLSRRSARLVSCWHDSTGTFRSAPSSFPMKSTPNTDGTVSLGAHSPCHRIGWRSEHPREDIIWLQGYDRAPFLFPNKNFGPDLLFRLQLEDSPELITVAVQVKLRNRSQDFSGPQMITDAIRTCTPKFFWKNKKNEVYCNKTLVITTRDLHDATIFELDRFKDPSKASNFHGVLRCLFVFPAVDNQATCRKILQVAKSQSDPHEFCVLPVTGMRSLEEVYKNMPVTQEYMKELEDPQDPVEDD